MTIIFPLPGVSLISLCLSSILVSWYSWHKQKRSFLFAAEIILGSYFANPSSEHPVLFETKGWLLFNSYQLLLTSVNRMLGCIQGSCSVHRGCSYRRKAFGQPDLRKNGMVTLIRSYPCFGLAAYSKSDGWASHFQVSKPLGCYNLQSPSINANPILHVSMMSTFNLKSLKGPLGLN
jgi:hypothetical protein